MHPSFATLKYRATSSLFILTIAIATMVPFQAMADTGIRATQPNPTSGNAITKPATSCQPLVDDVAQKQELLAELKSDFSLGPDRPRLLRNATTAVSLAKQKLQACVHPALTPPNLRPVDVTLHFEPGNTALDATLLIVNDGQLPAVGAFSIDFGYQYDGHAFHQRKMILPATTRIEPNTTYSAVFSQLDFERANQTETRTYLFWALVDADQQIAEGNEADNPLPQTGPGPDGGFPKTITIPGSAALH